ncbi:hypothetical protein [Kingella oralis]|uniref:hypothetical protein n=1 Tax=Kingella oralis TaxID=505 RepID=UPI0034E4F459
MNEQFKFGDRVKYRATDFLFIHDKGDGRAHVVSETGVSGAALISDLTLIPHPDTVRLDWLLENSGINVGEEDYYRRNYVYDRAAIDAAMNKEKNND